MSSRSVDWKHLCLAGWIPAKVISFSRSLCTLFLLLLLLFFASLPSKLSPVSPIFLLRVQGKSLCSASLPVVYSGKGSGAGVLQGSHQLARRFPSALAQCQPVASLRLVLYGFTLGGVNWQTELLQEQSNRKSMRNDFLYFVPVKEKGVRQGTKGCLKTFLVGECATREWGV